MSEILATFASALLLASAILSHNKGEDKPPFRHDPPTRYEKAWDNCKIRPNQVFRIDKAIGLYQERKSVYNRIERMRDGGVPAAVVFCLHGRESSWSMKKHLHEGSPLTGRTRWIPKGRPKAPPANGHTYTFYESAEDVLYKLKDLESVDWTKVHNAFWNIEAYNGWGYHKYRGIKSPYVYSGTYYYTKGKYVADGRYSSSAVDKQLGVMAILKRMEQRGIDVGFR